MRPENNFAFIDAQNLHCGIEELGWNIDYRRFRMYLREQYHITKAFIFIGYQQKNQALYTYLQAAGFILIFKQLHPNAPSKGNVDVDLTLNTVSLMNTYDHALLITSDGDFASLVQHLQTAGKLLGVMSPRHEKCSLLLRQAAGATMRYLTPIRHKIERQEKGR